MAGMRRLPARRDGSATLGNERVALLGAFLSYVETFFHGRPQTHTRKHTSGCVGGYARGSSRSLLYQGHQQHGVSQTRAFASAPPAFPSPRAAKRSFHNYFVTHLPSSSLHPDSRNPGGLHHKLPRAASTPHTPGPGSSPAASPPNMPSRDLTVVRIPLRSAKHHFGAYNARGSRPYNEDTNQAGTINMPAFAKRAPISLVRSAMANSRSSGEGINADSASGDPQIFYFAVFDGHGGIECSEFLREELHGYIEEAAVEFGLGSSLRREGVGGAASGSGEEHPDIPDVDESDSSTGKEESLEQVDMKDGEEVRKHMSLPGMRDGSVVEEAARADVVEGEAPVSAESDLPKAVQLGKALLAEYKDTVGGYFRRFKPANFEFSADRPSNGDDGFASGSASTSNYSSSSSSSSSSDATPPSSTTPPPITAESVLTYAFLRADLDFVTAQARKPDPDDPYVSDFPLNQDEVLGSPHLPPSGQGIGGPARFKGGSTASVALISTPTPAPFWHPAAHSTLLVAHVGDTRVLLCETATGLARPLTRDHHPSSPSESRRLTRYAESLVTDSFGEERISGLANSRAFGDMQSKRIGVSAEPEITRLELGPAEYSFLVLVSDGVSGTLGDQEIVDVVKEARTPEQGARAVVDYATEISADGDNATCLVVRLGGWERRSEGGLGSLGTKEIRDIRRAEALDPRRGRR